MRLREHSMSSGSGLILAFCNFHVFMIIIDAAHVYDEVILHGINTVRRETIHDRYTDGMTQMSDVWK